MRQRRATRPSDLRQEDDHSAPTRQLPAPLASASGVASASGSHLRSSVRPFGVTPSLVCVRLRGHTFALRFFPCHTFRFDPSRGHTFVFPNTLPIHGVTSSFFQDAQEIRRCDPRPAEWRNTRPTRMLRVALVGGTPLLFRPPPFAESHLRFGSLTESYLRFFKIPALHAGSFPSARGRDVKVNSRRSRGVTPSFSSVRRRDAKV